MSFEVKVLEKGKFTKFAFATKKEAMRRFEDLNQYPKHRAIAITLNFDPSPKEDHDDEPETLDMFNTP